MDTKFVKALSLYVDGKAVDVPQEPTWSGDLVEYKRGMDVRLGKTVLGKELTWIRIQDFEGNETFLCDRCLVNHISRNDCKSLIGYEVGEDGIHATVDLPTAGQSEDEDCDWTRALEIVGEDESRLHWKEIYSIGRETWEKPGMKMVAIRGYSGARNWYYSDSFSNYFSSGWRPALRILDTDISRPVMSFDAEPYVYVKNNGKIVDSWIPVERRLPHENAEVQVTYLGYYDKKPLCNAFAYLHNKRWYWSFDDEPVIVPIVAWKPITEPFHSLEQTKVTSQRGYYSWHTESWGVEDIENSLQQNGIPVTEENVQTALSVVKEKRRELLDAVIRECFKK